MCAAVDVANPTILRGGLERTHRTLGCVDHPNLVLMLLSGAVRSVQATGLEHLSTRSAGYEVLGSRLFRFGLAVDRFGDPYLGPF